MSSLPEFLGGLDDLAKQCDAEHGGAACVLTQNTLRMPLVALEIPSPQGLLVSQH